jgi:hypothetical protein
MQTFMQFSHSFCSRLHSLKGNSRFPIPPHRSYFQTLNMYFSAAAARPPPSRDAGVVANKLKTAIQ